MLYVALAIIVLGAVVGFGSFAFAAFNMGNHVRKMFDPDRPIGQGFGSMFTGHLGAIIGMVAGGFIAFIGGVIGLVGLLQMAGV